MILRGRGEAAERRASQNLFTAVDTGRSATQGTLVTTRARPHRRSVTCIRYHRLRAAHRVSLGIYLMWNILQNVKLSPWLNFWRSTFVTRGSKPRSDSARTRPACSRVRRREEQRKGRGPLARNPERHGVQPLSHLLPEPAATASMVMAASLPVGSPRTDCCGRRPEVSACWVELSTGSFFPAPTLIDSDRRSDIRFFFSMGPLFLRESGRGGACWRGCGEKGEVQR